MINKYVYCSNRLESILNILQYITHYHESSILTYLYKMDTCSILSCNNMTV